MTTPTQPTDLPAPRERDSRNGQSAVAEGEDEMVEESDWSLNPSVEVVGLASGIVAIALLPFRARRLVPIASLVASVPALYLLALRPWLLHWGATEAEGSLPLPGDELEPEALYQTTRAITIDAQPEDVWPWLVQLGMGRGGFYSYDWLEQAAGVNIENADRVVPELQHLAVGDTILAGTGSKLEVVRLDAQRTLVLHAVWDLRTGQSIPATAPVEYALDWTWAFVLRPTGTTTRLLLRTRGVFKPHTLAPAFSAVLEPVHFVMERQMLRGIKARAERLAAAELALGTWASTDG